MRGFLLSRAVVLSCTIVSAAYGQPAPPSAFEVASVKPAARSDGRVRPSMRGGPGTPDSDRITFTSVTLMNVLLRAYDVKAYQVTGPDWLLSERYDITAKIPPGATKEQFLLMLQRLLTERFRLAVHHETKELQGYELVRGKSGPKLKPTTEGGPNVEPTEQVRTDANGFPQLSAPGLVMMEGVQGKAVVSFVTARAQPLSALVETLSKEFRMPVTDQTGLTGTFDFTLEFAPQAPGALPPDTPDESAPNLISAVPQQLGLKLQAKKIRVDILVVDSAGKIPAEN
jgi:uncharacterized protein (TIGR03435 family)